MEKLLECKVCGRPLASSAKACPGCATEDPFGKKAALARVVIVASLLVGGYLLWDHLPKAIAIVAGIPEFVRQHQ
uniref:Uncharacterized protein n=1 Tax=Magnetospirillum gryphiswaldense TaxID=55518 RepID=A4TU69_9PROT|nr:hypothetical protein MGR_1066 [Magnetospirillum gryphiswaldense MSR-1]